MAPRAKRQTLETVKTHIALISGQRTGFATDPYRLNLRNSSDLNETKLREFAASRPGIQHLDLTACFPLNSSAMRVMGENWAHSLLSVSFEYCDWLTDSDLAMFTQFASFGALSIQRINLSHTSISDLGVRHLVKACPQLQSINLQGCSSLTNLSLSMIAQNCKNITSLDVSDCPQLTDYGVGIIAQESKCNLQELNLNGCSSITGSIFRYLAFFCPNLRRLQIRGTNISGNEVSQFLSRFPSLLELNVHGLSFNDEHLRQIALSQPSLEVLDISFCYYTSSTGINTILDMCSNLQELHVYGKNMSLADFESAPAGIKIYL